MRLAPSALARQKEKQKEKKKPFRKKSLTGMTARRAEHQEGSRTAGGASMWANQ